MPEFITIGEASVVLAAKTIGRMRYAKDFELRPGSAESTVAVGVHRLGHSTGLISQLGADELGHYMLALIRGEGVDVSNIRLATDKQTGLFLREKLPQGEARHFYYRTDSAFTHMRPEYLAEDYIASAKILHVTGITPALSHACRQTVEAAVAMARQHGVLVIFDPNLRLKLWRVEEAQPVMEKLMRAADYILPGLEEMQQLYGPKPADEIIAYLHVLGCERIIMKIGKQGAILSAGSHTEQIAGHADENPIDLMGAGDAFAAGFIAGLLKGMAPGAAVDLANLVASLSIKLPGNIESLPTWDEVDRAAKGALSINR